MITILTAEIGKLRAEIQSESERFEKTRDGLQDRLAQTEKEMTIALENEKSAHEDDVERLSREKVGVVK